MLTEERKYFLQGGDTGKPFIQIKKINPAMQVVACNYLAQPGDVEISKVQYDNYATALNVAFIVEVQNRNATRYAQVDALKTAISAALMSTGMTQQNIDDMFAMFAN